MTTNNFDDAAAACSGIASITEANTSRIATSDDNVSSVRTAPRTVNGTFGFLGGFAGVLRGVMRTSVDKFRKSLREGSEEAGSALLH